MCEGDGGAEPDRLGAAAGETGRGTEGLAGEGREPSSRGAGPRPLEREAVGRVVDGPPARAGVRPREAEVVEVDGRVGIREPA